LVVTALCARASYCQAWKTKLSEELTKYGHRNWIVVADSAYPLQVPPGIETILADADQLTVVREVITDLAEARHVRAIVYTDSELSFVPEQDAKGVGAYREGLAKLLYPKTLIRLCHMSRSCKSSIRLARASRS